MALGDDRLPALDRDQPFVDLFHGRFVQVQRGGAGLGDQRAGGLVGVGEAWADQRRWRTLPRSSPRVEHGDRADGGQNHGDDDQDDCDDHVEQGFKEVVRR